VDALRQKRPMGECGDGPFAVGPGDVKRAEASFGVAECRAERLHVLQAQLDPEVLEREEAI
jgi:hypothetical protein